MKLTKAAYPELVFWKPINKEMVGQKSEKYTFYELLMLTPKIGLNKLLPAEFLI